MSTPHNLVVQGKVLYLVRCFPLSVDDPIPHDRDSGNLRHTSMGHAQDESAKDHGKTPFSIYQGKWSELDHSSCRWPMLRGLRLRHGTSSEAGKPLRCGGSTRKGRTIVSPNWEPIEEERKVHITVFPV